MRTEPDGNGAREGGGGGWNEHNQAYFVVAWHLSITHFIPAKLATASIFHFR